MLRRPMADRNERHSAIVWQSSADRTLIRCDERMLAQRSSKRCRNRLDHGSRILDQRSSKGQWNRSVQESRREIENRGTPNFGQSPMDRSRIRRRKKSIDHRRNRLIRNRLAMISVRYYRFRGTWPLPMERVEALGSDQISDR